MTRLTGEDARAVWRELGDRLALACAEMQVMASSMQAAEGKLAVVQLGPVATAAVNAALAVIVLSGVGVPKSLIDQIGSAHSANVLRLLSQTCECEECTAKRKAGHAAMH